MAHFIFVLKSISLRYDKPLDCNINMFIMYIRTYVHTYTTSFNIYIYIVDIYIFAIVAIYSFLQTLWFDSDIEGVHISYLMYGLKSWKDICIPIERDYLPCFLRHLKSFTIAFLFWLEFSFIAAFLLSASN